MSKPASKRPAKPKTKRASIRDRLASTLTVRQHFIGQALISAEAGASEQIRAEKAVKVADEIVKILDAVIAAERAPRSETVHGALIITREPDGTL